MMDFDRQPCLTDGTMSLCALRAAEWTGLYAVASDPLPWAVHPARDRWQGAKFRTFFDDALASGGALAIVDPATGAVIAPRALTSAGLGGGRSRLAGLCSLARIRAVGLMGHQAADAGR